MSRVSAKILVHASVVSLRDDRVLMVLESKSENHGRWNLPGGHIEIGETVIDGAVRECREEVGLEVRPLHLVGIYTGISVNTHAIRFVFVAEVSNGNPVPGAGVLEARFIPRDELSNFDDSELVAPRTFRAILSDVSRGRKVPLKVFVDGVKDL